MKARFSGGFVSMSDGQLCYGALIDANRRIDELKRQMANVQQRAREAVLGSAAALREAELMRDSHFDNLRTANASIARLREALTEAREHLADATPKGTRAKIDAALGGAPATSGQGGACDGDRGRRHTPARHGEFAHTVHRGADDRSGIIGKDAGQHRQVAREFAHGAGDDADELDDGGSQPLANRNGRRVAPCTDPSAGLQRLWITIFPSY